MRIETNNLITVKRYANAKGISLTWAYKQIKDGAIKSVEIDGVRFVIVR